jgi:hypothetical protein
MAQPARASLLGRFVARAREAWRFSAIPSRPSTLAIRALKEEGGGCGLRLLQFRKAT